MVSVRIFAQHKHKRTAQTNTNSTQTVKQGGTSTPPRTVTSHSHGGPCRSLDAAFEIEKLSQTKPPAPLTHVSRAHHEAPEDRPSGAILEDGNVAPEDAPPYRCPRISEIGPGVTFPSVFSFRPILTGIISWWWRCVEMMRSAKLEYSTLHAGLAKRCRSAHLFVFNNEAFFINLHGSALNEALIIIRFSAACTPKL